MVKIAIESWINNGRRTTVDSERKVTGEEGEERERQWQTGTGMAAAVGELGVSARACGRHGRGAKSSKDVQSSGVDRKVKWSMR